MSVVAELSKLQERKDAPLREVALIDKELEAAALALGVRRQPVNHRPATNSIKPSRSREPGETWNRIQFWLRAQSSAKTVKEIAEGTMLAVGTIHNHITARRTLFVHRGTRWGLSEAQFADHSADLEEQSRGNASESASTLPTAQSMTGATVSLNASTITESTAPVAIVAAKNSERDSINTIQSLGEVK